MVAEWELVGGSIQHRGVSLKWEVIRLITRVIRRTSKSESLELDWSCNPPEGCVRIRGAAHWGGFGQNRQSYGGGLGLDQRGVKSIYFRA